MAIKSKNKKGQKPTGSKKPSKAKAVSKGSATINTPLQEPKATQDDVTFQAVFKEGLARLKAAPIRLGAGDLLMLLEANIITRDEVRKHLGFPKREDWTFQSLQVNTDPQDLESEETSDEIEVIQDVCEDKCIAVEEAKYDGNYDAGN
jgi:hypothetical protein